MKTHRTLESSPTARRVEDEQLRAAQQAVAQGEAVPHGIRSVGILVLAVLALIYTLYFGKEILLPIALAVVLKLLLQPVMRLLQQRLRFPGALASLLLIITVFGAIAAVGFTLSVPAFGVDSESAGKPAAAQGEVVGFAPAARFSAVWSQGA